MNKVVIDEMIPIAYKYLKPFETQVDSNEISKTFRGQISSFGAALTMGSTLSAIAFYSDKGSASVDRTLILSAIFNVLKDYKIINGESNLFEYAKNKAESEVKENIVNASIALKLAINLYKLV